MPRPPRITPVGMPFHVLNRGNERRTLFRKSGEFERFLDRVEQTVEKYPIKILSYCLMTNHWHFVMMGLADRAISDAMQWLSSGQACELRRIENTVGYGHVYQQRFKSFPIGSKRYLLNAIRYVEANPWRAGLVERAEEWQWSSLWDRVQRSSRKILCNDFPMALPPDWVEIVNTPLSDRLMERLHASVRDGMPYGPRKWAETIAEELKLNRKKTEKPEKQ